MRTRWAGDAHWPACRAVLAVTCEKGTWGPCQAQLLAWDGASVRVQALMLRQEARWPPRLAQPLLNLALNEGLVCLSAMSRGQAEVGPPGLQGQNAEQDGSHGCTLANKKLMRCKSHQALCPVSEDVMACRGRVCSCSC